MIYFNETKGFIANKDDITKGLRELASSAIDPIYAREISAAVLTKEKRDSLYVLKGYHQPQWIGNYKYDHITVACKYYPEEEEEITFSKQSDGITSVTGMKDVQLKDTYHLYCIEGNILFRKVSSSINQSNLIDIEYIYRSDNKILGILPSSLFQGYDSVSGAGLSTAIIGKTKTVGGTSSVYYSVTKSITELYEKLDISSSLSAGFGSFASLSAKVKFVDELKLTEDSICILVRAKHTMHTETTSDYEFKEGVAPTNSDELISFTKAYGDSFISEITLGAEYYAVYAFRSYSDKQKQNIDTELKANGIGSWGKINVDFQAKLDKVVEHTNVDYSFSQNISGIENPKLPKPDELVQYAIDFLNLPVNQAAIISYHNTSYDKVPNAKTDLFKQIRKNIYYFAENSDFSNSYETIYELINKLSQIIEIYHFYEFNNDKKVYKVLEMAKSDLDKLKNQLYNYGDNPTEVFELPELDSLTEGIPELQYNISYSDERGGNGGVAFNDVNVDNYIEQRTKISEIELYAESVIRALNVTYQSLGKPAITVNHGVNGGNMKKISLSNTFIEKIRGRSGSYIDRLEITAKNGNEIYNGGNGGNEFSFSLPTQDSVIIGFMGRSGANLDNVRVVIATFNKAKWIPRF